MNKIIILLIVGIFATSFSADFATGIIYQKEVEVSPPGSGAATVFRYIVTNPANGTWNAINICDPDYRGKQLIALMDAAYETGSTVTYNNSSKTSVNGWLVYNNTDDISFKFDVGGIDNIFCTGFSMIGNANINDAINTFVNTFHQQGFLIYDQYFHCFIKGCELLYNFANASTTKDTYVLFKGEGGRLDVDANIFIHPVNATYNQKVMTNPAGLNDVRTWQIVKNLAFMTGRRSCLTYFALYNRSSQTSLDAHYGKKSLGVNSTYTADLNPFGYLSASTINTWYQYKTITNGIVSSSYFQAPLPKLPNGNGVPAFAPIPPISNTTYTDHVAYPTKDGTNSKMTTTNNYIWHCWPDLDQVSIHTLFHGDKPLGGGEYVDN